MDIDSAACIPPCAGISTSTKKKKYCNRTVSNTNEPQAHCSRQHSPPRSHLSEPPPRSHDVPSIGLCQVLRQHTATQNSPAFLLCNVVLTRAPCYRRDLARDMGENSYAAPDLSSSIHASAGGSSCAKFCMWGVGGKAFHPPHGDTYSATVSFL